MLDPDNRGAAPKSTVKSLLWCPKIKGPQRVHIMEVGPQNHSRDGLMVPNSIMVVYKDPLGN